MKKAYIIGMMSLAAALLTSCEPDKDPKLTVPTDLVLETPEYASELVELTPVKTLEFKVEKAAYNVALTPEYRIETSIYEDFGDSEEAKTDEEGNIIPNTMVVDPVDPFSTELVLSGETLDLALLKMYNVTSDEAFKALQPSPVYMRVIAEVADNKATRVVSNAIKLDQVKLYYTSEALPFVCTPGGGCNWSFGACGKLAAYEKDAETGEWVKYRGLSYLKDEVKFTLGEGWGTNWGAGASDGVMAPGAGNIPVPAEGIYYVEVDTKALTYTLTPAEVCVIGDLNGWDTNTAPAMSKVEGDACVLTYTGTFADGGFKFIVNPKTSGWSINYGGELENIEFNAGNIPSTAGEHTVTLNVTTVPYTATFD